MIIAEGKLQTGTCRRVREDKLNDEEQLLPKTETPPPAASHVTRRKPSLGKRSFKDVRERFFMREY